MGDAVSVPSSHLLLLYNALLLNEEQTETRIKIELTRNIKS
jgi:hypothetical protein